VQTFQSAALRKAYLSARPGSSTAGGRRPQRAPRRRSGQGARTESQQRHVDGTPWGHARRFALDYTFPATALLFPGELHGTRPDRGSAAWAEPSEQIDLSINARAVRVMGGRRRKISETEKKG